MDGLTLLHRFDADLPEPDDTVLEQTRTALRSAFGQESLPRQQHSASRFRLSATITPGRIVIGVAAAAVAAVVTVGLVTAGPVPRASAEAAHLLQCAASTARAGSAPSEPRTLTIHEEALGINGETAGPVEAAYLGRKVSVLRVPGPGGTWTRTSWSLPATQVFGGAAGRDFAAREYTEEAHANDPNVERSPNGNFTVDNGAGGDLWSDPERLRALPRDPVRLLKTLQDSDVTPIAGTGQAAKVIEAASEVLRSGAADPDLQAALFEALRLQDGITVQGRVTDLLGRDGVAIGARPAPADPMTEQLILDPDTGRYLGERDVELTRLGVIPAGTVSDQTAVQER